jgi:multimeric flavodoxin WrbA
MHTISNIATQPVDARRFLFLLTSSRENGNTEQLARYASTFLPEGAEQVWLNLNDYEMPAFSDRRHDGDGTYPAPEGKMAILLGETLAATDLVFVTPLYWYSLPTSAKQYLDHWSAWMRVPGIDFLERMKGRNLWNITVLADEDTSNASALTDTLHRTADYAGMSWRGALLGYGNRPGDVMHDHRVLRDARRFLNAENRHEVPHRHATAK